MSTATEPQPGPAVRIVVDGRVREALFDEPSALLGAGGLGDVTKADDSPGWHLLWAEGHRWPGAAMAAAAAALAGLDVNGELFHGHAQRRPSPPTPASRRRLRRRRRWRPPLTAATPVWPPLADPAVPRTVRFNLFALPYRALSADGPMAMACPGPDGWAIAREVVVQAPLDRCPPGCAAVYHTDLPTILHGLMRLAAWSARSVPSSRTRWRLGLTWWPAVPPTCGP